MSITIDYSDRERSLPSIVANMRDNGQLLCSFKVLGIENGSHIAELADLRIYSSLSRNSQRIGAALWIHCAGHWALGGGYVGGWGYHKGSAAASIAIREAGITLEKSVSGVGYAAVTEALKAICAEIIAHKGADISHLTVIEAHA